MIQHFSKIGKKIFGTQNDRELKTIYPIVQKINDLEPSIKALSDDQLKAQTVKLLMPFMRLVYPRVVVIMGFQVYGPITIKIIMLLLNF